MGAAGKEVCAICAWRGNCQKMFSVSGRDVRCPDFVRDISVKSKEPEEGTEEIKGEQNPDGSQK